MFLAAAPYFQSRFRDNQSILAHFQSSITSVSCLTNLSSMLLLSKMQSKASYPKRIIFSLIINTVVFAVLALSILFFRNVSGGAYLVFTLLMVFASSIATGLCQNGSFAFAASFGRPEYIQAIMTGQAVAGVLPSMAQILSVLAVPEPDHWDGAPPEPTAVSNENTTSAFIYFLTATGISAVTIVTVFPLLLKRIRVQNSQVVAFTPNTEDGMGSRKREVVGMMTLYRKLSWLPPTIFTCFLVTMFFPVFTQKVLSVVPADEASRILQPATFIPLGFLVWNIGDLTGRLLTLVPTSFRTRPIVFFLFALLRLGFIPLYQLCNIEGKGAVIDSDIFYLLVVQIGFGVTNGLLGSSTMMAAQRYVAGTELEATGGFMAFNLVAGLTAGSLLSFTVSGVS